MHSISMDLQAQFATGSSTRTVSYTHLDVYKRQAGVLQAIRQGQSGTAAIDAVPASMRPGVQALSFQVLRFLGRAQALRKLLAPRTPPPAADALLCVALALLWRKDDAPYDAFTLVNQAVESAKKTLSIKPQAAFLNACLRRFLRERDALVAVSDLSLIHI